MDTLPMSCKSWTWDERIHPEVAAALTSPATELDWCDRLEAAPQDALVGKVLCVCAAAAIARAVVAAAQNEPEAIDALDLLDRWIDDPTDERFEKICSLIFAEGGAPDFGPHGVGWWALRTATSSVGNFEGGWALSSTCGAAEKAGFGSDVSRKIAAQAVLARYKRAEPNAAP